jgi:hypothetical protein
LRFSAQRVARLHRVLCAGVGAFSIALGLHLIWEFAAARVS